MLRALNQAALAISQDLDLDTTLKHIVDSARELVSARYAALGVFDREGNLERFIHSGLSEQEAAAIDHLPEGRGLLGAVLESEEPIRLERLSDDARSSGFPEGHPSMTTFLGCPIRVDGKTLGNLYLTDRVDGSPFSQEDQDLIEIFSSHAAAAIKNAHLFQASLKRARELGARNRELAALYAVAQATGTYAQLEQVTEHALKEVLTLTGAEAGEIFLLEPGGNDLVLAMHQGEDAQAFHTVRRFPVGVGFPGKVAETGQVLATNDLANEAQYLRSDVIAAGFVSYVCVPLKAKGEVLGTLNLAAKRSGEFSERDLTLLGAIGNLIGTAVENARLYEEVGRLAVIEERSRIGMDLHDGVIQSIYAVGLTLETVQHLTGQDPERSGELLDQAIEGLNDAIRDIRNFILDLRPRRFEGDLAEGLSRLVREFQANTMVDVEVTIDRELASSLPPSISRAFFLTAQEGLANIARHARASHVELQLKPRPDGAGLRISDDGQGFEPEQQDQSVGHGLANMESRAEALNGRFTIQSTPGQGTTLLLHLPTSG